MLHGTNEVVLSPEAITAAIEEYINSRLLLSHKITVVNILYYKNSRRVKATIVPEITVKQKKEIEATSK